MPKGIKIKIYSQKSYKKAENTNLFFEITNHSQNTIRILKWNTPLEGLRSPCLDVKNKNKQIKYDGILVKRGAPTEKDYLILKPGQSASNRKFQLRRSRPHLM